MDHNSSRIQKISKRSDPVQFRSNRRTLSSSSFSSFSSCSSSSLLFSSADSPLNSPATPLRLLGVPFSWELLPGKPKDYSYRRKIESTNNLLPLPPHRNTSLPTKVKVGTEASPTPIFSGSILASSAGKPTRKKNTSPVAIRDPFAAALVQCSKDDEEDEEDSVNDGDGGSSKALWKRSIGFMNLYDSCRNACEVSESIVYLPNSTGAPSYDHLLLNRRRSR